VSMKKPHRSNGSLPLQFAAAYRRVVRHSKIGRSMSALGHCVRAMSALPPKDGVIGRRLVDSWKNFGCCASG
jgi:hypothetical protein